MNEKKLIAEIINKQKKSIAEFMNVPKCDRCSKDCEAFKFGPSIYYLPDQMKYDKEWNWIMPVVEKIESLGYHFFIFPGNHIQINENGTISSAKICKISDSSLSKIESFYQAIVKFIEWYNTFKNTQIGKCQILSPDGISINPEGFFPNFTEARKYFDEWVKRFEKQGYYSSNNGPIKLEDLEEHCTLIEL